MTLQIGKQLGSYEITSLLDKGGMGEVYRAKDTKLGREVAIKVLPERFARESDRLTRFRREAQLLASLNHTNIAQIYGLEDSGDTHGLVMEMVPGETLRDRIGRDGAVPVEEALGIAIQIAAAMEHAHEKNIIHRDLKPANIKLTPDGKVKVLDFGLAKAFAGDGAETAPGSNSPTLCAAATAQGVILGTAAYMSPEQAKGKTVDRRADIWGLGCVLYELLTGKAAFEGDSVTEILGSVLRAEPDWSALPGSTPPTIRALLRRCLRKDMQQRPRDAADIRLELEEARAAAAPAAATVVLPAPAPVPRRWLLLAALACVLVAAVTGIVIWQLRPASPRPVERLVSALPANTTLPQANFGVLALSPDGRRLAYVAGSTASQRLYLRSMDALEAAPLAGTDGALNPFFSPDGEWIGFAQGGALKKISVGGGAALTLCDVNGAMSGAAWGADNTIVVALNGTSALVKVSAAGSQPQPLTALQQGEASHRWPQFLPDGKTVLFTIGTGATIGDEAQIAAQRLDSGERKVLVRGGTYGRYIPTGHLVYYRAGTIMAVPFDPVKLELKGSAFPVVEAVSGAAATGVAHFSFSNLGSLAYLRGVSQSLTQTMVWVNRQGLATPIPAPPRNYRAPRLSPDGRQVAVGIGSDIWIYDISREALTKLTYEGNNTLGASVWTPDGKRVVYPSDRSGPTNLFWKAADGSGPEERLASSPNTQRAGTISRDGRFEMIEEFGPKTGTDLWVLPLEGDRKPSVFLQTPFQELSPQISPDGRWVAYTSNESGRLEVYVRPFPGPGGKWQVSTDGGSEVAWSPKGNELFYRTGARKEKMMVSEYQTQPTFSAGKSRLLFEGNYVASGALAAGVFYSVAPDGQRFLMTKTPEQSQAALTQINVVLNWFEELKQKVPVK